MLPNESARKRSVRNYALLHDGATRARGVRQSSPLVYTELHRQAARYLRRERQDHTLQTTALIHERI